MCVRGGGGEGGRAGREGGAEGGPAAGKKATTDTNTAAIEQQNRQPADGALGKNLFQRLPACHNHHPQPPPHCRPPLLPLTVEVVSGEARLAAGHVAADDEVGAAIVAADEHVLQRLAGAGHVHRVGQVGPPVQDVGADRGGRGQ